MRIAEIFQSIQGEGLLAGVPSVFIRTSGCNLRCWFCDTDYTSWRPEGETKTVGAVLAEIAGFSSKHAVVTGGEPMLAPDIQELCQALRERGYHITIETAATIFKPVECDLASLSPKLSSSTPWRREGGRFAEQHEELRLQIDVIRAFIDRGEYQLKFVIDRKEDVDEVLALLPRLPDLDPSRVLLMPQGVTPEEVHQRGRWVAEECQRHGFRYCPRLHIELWGNVRGR